MIDWQLTKYQRPMHEEKIIYWSSRVGMWRGQYDRKYKTFHSRGGFMDVHDVECWQRDEGQDFPSSDSLPEELGEVVEEWKNRHK